MGRGFIEYRMPAAGHTHLVTYSAFLEYRLADGSALWIEQGPAWCRRCGTFVLAEQLPSLADLRARLAAVQAGDPETIQRLAFVGSSADEEAAELARRIAWREERRGPARCLECGADGVLPVPTSGEFRHPVSGERVDVEGSGFVSTKEWAAVFTPEGIRCSGSESER